ncbi:MAG: DNA translocase FtsK [Saprospiraceae bacterium]|nr:DNA translocase FtsK [Saprospiraceae bacterium]
MRNNKKEKNQLKKDVTKKANEKSKSKRKSPFKSFFNFLKNEKLHHVSGLLFILFAIYLFVVFISHIFTWKIDFDITTKSLNEIYPGIEIHNIGGYIGTQLSFLFINKWFGIASFLFILLFLVIGARLLTGIEKIPIWKSFKHSFFGLIWISIAMGFLFVNNDILSGYVGYYLNIWLNSIIGRIGVGILLLFSIFAYLIVSFNFSFNWLKSIFKAYDSTNDEQYFDEAVNQQFVVDGENGTEAIELDDPFLVTETEEDLQETSFELDTPESQDKEKIEDLASKIEITVEKAVVEETSNGSKEHYTVDTDYDPTLDLRDYKMPTLDLLESHGTNVISVEKDELEENKNRIIKTLNNYAIQIQKIKATIGPTITLYEIVPAPGVRISKIKNLEDDIALSLSALGIRIIAPMPGKGTIGIEVPNKKPEIVSMRTILASERFQTTTFDLPIGLGKTISNESFIADLAKMPHLLMAGATGQGKSVGLNAILASLLYKKHPSQVKFVLVDPKKVELTLFSKIERHFLAKLPDSEEAIITDTRKVVRTLNSMCIEMDTRYELLKDAQVRNIKEYNAKFISRKLNPNDGHRYLPYIVLVVDEFADLIMTAGKEIEAPIARIAQLARAIGIHLIIATQRPSVNIITGTIKANFPARIAFRVTSKIDSRTILDGSGADQLIGRGDMLMATGSDVIRLQCAFIDTPEIEKITEFIGSQRAYPDAYHLPEYADEEDMGIKEFNPDERDDLFEDAARIIVQSQHGSTSLLQRKLKLGYNRAGRIIDQLEAAGIVGPFEGSKAREVRISDEYALEQFLKDNL